MNPMPSASVSTLPAAAFAPASSKSPTKSEPAARSTEQTAPLARYSKRFVVPNPLKLTLPVVHNKRALGLSAAAAALSVGSIVSLLQLTSALGPTVAIFAAASVAPLTAAAGISATGALTGVAIYVLGAAFVAAAAACAVVFVVMQARIILYAACLAKHALTNEKPKLTASARLLRRELANTGLVGLWTSMGLMPLSPLSATSSALAVALCQTGQAVLSLHA